MQLRFQIGRGKKRQGLYGTANGLRWKITRGLEVIRGTRNRITQETDAEKVGFPRFARQKRAQ